MYLGMMKYEATAVICSEPGKKKYDSQELLHLTGPGYLAASNP